MKTFKIFIVLLCLSLLFTWLYSSYSNDDFNSFKIGFPFTIYYEFHIDKKKKFSYLPINLLKNIIIFLIGSIILVRLFIKKNHKKKKK